MIGKKKVLIAINCMNIGGAPAVVLAELRSLDRARFEPWLLTLYQSKPANFLSEAEAIVGKEHLISFELARRSPFDLPTLVRIWRFLRHERFDVVVTHLFLANLIVRPLAALARAPRIISFEHSRYAEKRLWQRVADRALARLTYRIVVAHEEIARFTAEQEHLAPEKFAVIPNPLEAPPTDEVGVAAVRQAWNVPEGRVVFLSLGRFSDEKGHRFLIEAARRLIAEHPEAFVLIVGHGPRQGLLASMVREAGIERDCRIIADPARARYAYALADAFVLPSLREGESIATREAMLAGLPVIASDLPTLHALVSEDAGLLVPAGDEGALAAALARLAGDAALRRRLAEGARLRAASFDLDAHGRILAELLS